MSTQTLKASSIPPPPQSPKTSETTTPLPSSSQPPNPNITISLLADPSSAHASATSAWKSLFGTKSSKPQPDQPTFKATYSHPNGRLLIASTPCTPVAGIIAYRKYDDRFANSHPELDFSDASRSTGGAANASEATSSSKTLEVVEVIRLFVEPALRQRGIATLLVRALVAQAREDGVRIMYLHTHPFLPGAQGLWEKEGWRVVVRETEEPWCTIHMRRDLV